MNTRENRSPRSCPWQWQQWKQWQLWQQLQQCWYEHLVTSLDSVSNGLKANTSPSQLENPHDPRNSEHLILTIPILKWWSLFNLHNPSNPSKSWAFLFFWGSSCLVVLFVIMHMMTMNMKMMKFARTKHYDDNCQGHHTRLDHHHDHHADHLHVRAPLRRPKVWWWHKEQSDVVRSNCLDFDQW